MCVAVSGPVTRFRDVLVFFSVVYSAHCVTLPSLVTCNAGRHTPVS